MDRNLAGMTEPDPNDMDKMQEFISHSWYEYTDGEDKGLHPKNLSRAVEDSATVTAINTGEVWVKRSDGNKSKLYIAQLKKGKYTIRHVPY